MSDSCLEYGLRDGYVHNWLVAGPLAIHVPHLERFQRKASDIHEPPIQRGILAAKRPGWATRSLDKSYALCYKAARSC